MRIRKRLTYANVVSTLALFVALGGATAFAATELAKNSVGSKQLKRNAVTAAKIKDGAVTGAKVKLDTLGTVPSAARAASAASAVRADTAGRADSAAKADIAARAESAVTADTAARADTARLVDGQITFSSRPFFGQTVTVAAHGPVSLVARCVRDPVGGDRVALLFRSAVNGAVARGDVTFTGRPPNDFLDVGESGLFIESSTAIGQTLVEGDTFDPNRAAGGFVLGPDGRGLVVNSGGTVLGLNYGGPGCLVAGVANAVG